jgi:hypothetical protein
MRRSLPAATVPGEPATVVAGEPATVVPGRDEGGGAEAVPSPGSPEQAATRKKNPREPIIKRQSEDDARCTSRS